MSWVNMRYSPRTSVQHLDITHRRVDGEVEAFSVVDAKLADDEAFRRRLVRARCGDMKDSDIGVTAGRVAPRRARRRPRKVAPLLGVEAAPQAARDRVRGRQDLECAGEAYLSDGGREEEKNLAGRRVGDVGGFVGAGVGDEGY